MSNFKNIKYISAVIITAFITAVFLYLGVHYVGVSYHTILAEKKIEKLLEFGPQQGGEPENVIILLQGSGMGPEDMMSVARRIAPAFPNTRFIAPSAILLDVIPGTRKWYDMLHKDEVGVVAHGVYRAGDTAIYLVNKIHYETGIPYNRIGVFGFSQGGSVALQVAMYSPKPLWGVVSFAGVLFPRERGVRAGDFYGTVAADWSDRLDIPYVQTPLLLFQGQKDKIIPTNHGKIAAHVMQQYVSDLSWVFVPDIGHEITNQTLEDIVDFFERHKR